jgi:drug/metabolite transporter (DMT)-like permease
MLRQYIILALGVVSVSFAAIFIRLAEAPPLIIATYRLCLASLLLGPVTWSHSRHELRRLSRRAFIMALLSGIFLALHFYLWISSLNYTTVTTSVILVTVNPVFVAIVSRFYLKERLSRQTALGIVVCIAGVLLIGYGNWKLGPNPLFGCILALLGALAAAGYLIIGRRLRQNVGLLSYTTLVYGSAGLLLLFATLILGYPLSGYSPGTYLMLGLLAVVSQLLGHSSLNWSLRYFSATLVTIAILGEPVGASIWAYLILDEAPTILEVAGCVLILSGIVVAFRRRGMPVMRQ